ncbi:MAG: thiamine biosynthesis protein ThiS [Alkaliphilus sp.]|jgi:sulfur carrier protein|nr:sulfur carrier protein ThiS [bacterium AH-315-G05]PHS35594.1 MAG: thiamine biosynthesis protein ThiS [Alkaliphilus sp.]
MIKVNGEEKNYVNCNILELIDNIELDKNRIVVEVNKVIIPRTQFDNYTLQDKDVVEIVHFVGGG